MFSFVFISGQTLESVEKSTMTRRSRLHHQDSDSDEDSCHDGNDSSDDDPDDDDDDEEDEEGGHCGKSRDLEWDNSTLTI